jgi:hypothetical protein
MRAWLLGVVFVVEGVMRLRLLLLLRVELMELELVVL